MPFNPEIVLGKIPKSDKSTLNLRSNQNKNHIKNNKNEGSHKVDMTKLN